MLPKPATTRWSLSAAFSEDRKTLTFAVLNPSDSEQQLKLAINGVKLARSGHLWRMAPPSVDATITVGQKPGVEVEEQGQVTIPDSIAVPPFSVSIYSFAVE